MKMGKLNQWLTLLANIGVLAGIVFLALETRQNGESIDQANRIAINSTTGELYYRNIDWLRVVLDNPHVAELLVKVSTSEDLTATETVQAVAIASQLAQLWISSETYFNNGLIDEQVFAAMVAAPRAALQNWPGLAPFLENYFPAERNGRVSESVRAAIEANR